MPPLSPNDLTRQQLDELDHLLQKMLQVPVAAPSAASEPARHNPPPLPTRSEGWGPDPLERHRMVDDPIPLSVAPLPFMGTLRGVDAPAGGFPRADLAYAPTIPTESPKLSRPAPFVPPVIVPQEIRLPLAHLPIYWANCLLEAVLSLFGPLGALLTHPFAKWSLGLAGIGLSLGAALHVARGLGWMATLPW